MNKVEKIVTNLVQPILKDLHFTLYDVDYSKKGPKWYLSVYIDKPTGGISINDCEQVSDKLGLKLDNLDPDPIPHAYNLDVSSPGAERPLKKPQDFKNSINRYVHVTLYYPVKKRKMYEGYLKSYNSKDLVIKYNDMSVMRDVKIPMKAIALARLAVKF
ncbi:MAG: ribosome maturation factor RimP [Acetilactobacillus jinshanensis]